MAGEISKQDQALTRAASLVGEARQDLNSQLQGLGGKLQGIGSQWRGSGAAAFMQVMERWNADARKIIQALETFEDNLKKSESTYTAADDAQQAAFQRLSGRLG